MKIYSEFIKQNYAELFLYDKVDNKEFSNFNNFKTNNTGKNRLELLDIGYETKRIINRFVDELKNNSKTFKAYCTIRNKKLDQFITDFIIKINTSR